MTTEPYEALRKAAKQIRTHRKANAATMIAFATWLDSQADYLVNSDMHFHWCDEPGAISDAVRIARVCLREDREGTDQWEC